MGYDAKLGEEYADHDDYIPFDSSLLSGDVEGMMVEASEIPIQPEIKGSIPSPVFSAPKKVSKGILDL